MSNPTRSVPSFIPGGAAVNNALNRQSPVQSPSSSIAGSGPGTSNPSAADVLRAKQAANDTSLRLFNRVAELTIAHQPTSTPGFISANPSFFDKLPNAILITGLRVKFEIKKNLGKEPNTCTVTVYNLSADTRRELDRKPLHIILRAGHDGVARLLFQGNATYAQSHRSGTEWETKIQVGDGARAYAHARMSRSYTKTTSVYQVLNDAATSMGLTLPPEIQRDPTLKQNRAQGMVAHGPTRDVLTRMLAPYGYNWSIQNGRLVILSDQLTTGVSPRVIDQDAGMIGSPERGIPHRPGDPSDCSVDCLLYPEIQPGESVDVHSQSVTGQFKVTDVNHSGDTHGSEWDTKIKALPLGAVKPKHTSRR